MSSRPIKKVCKDPPEDRTEQNTKMNSRPIKKEVCMDPPEDRTEVQTDKVSTLVLVNPLLPLQLVLLAARQNTKMNSRPIKKEVCMDPPEDRTEKPKMPVQHRFETSLLEKYKNLKLQGELFEKNFREEKKKRGAPKAPFKMSLEKFGKEIKNATPIAVHELLADLGHSVGYIEWLNEMGIRGGHATCFVLHGPYIITNHHVIQKIIGNEAAGAQWSMVSAKVATLARVSFNYKKLLPSKDNHWFNIESLKCWNPDLDYAVLQLKENKSTLPEQGIPPGLAQNIPDDISDELMYIIGHLNGGPKGTDTCKIISYSNSTDKFDERLKKRRAKICNPVYCEGVVPNEDIDCFHVLTKKSVENRDKHFPLVRNPDALAYDTSFFEGSSGSPVFSSSGALIALHTAGYTGKYKGSKQYIIEFGYSIKAIYADIKAKNTLFFQNLNDNRMEVDTDI